MIILAAAIILSLSNSVIIGKANKAKTDSDTANLKEYLNTLRAEYELMTADEQVAAGEFVDYANTKLAEKGYKRKLAADGKTIMNEAATAAVDAGIKIGDEVKYSAVLTAKDYITDGSETSPTGAADSTKTQKVKTNTSYTWKYIGLGENGSLLIAPDLTGRIDNDYKLTLGNRGGYLNGPKMLNTVCDALYTVEGKGKAQSMNIELVNKLLEYNGPKGMYYDTSKNLVETAEPKTIEETGLESSLGSNTQTPDGKDISTYYADCYYINKTEHASRITKDTVRQNLVYQSNAYWLASTCVNAYFNLGWVRFYVRDVDSSYMCSGAINMFVSTGNAGNYAYAVRPYVSLTTNVQKTTENGKTVWTLI